MDYCAYTGYDRNISGVFQKGINYLINLIDESGDDYYQSPYADFFYLLHKVGSPLASRYIDESKNNDFWGDDDPIDSLFECPEELYYLKKLGCDGNPNFDVCYQFFCENQAMSGTFLLRLSQN